MIDFFLMALIPGSIYLTLLQSEFNLTFNTTDRSSAKFAAGVNHHLQPHTSFAQQVRFFPSAVFTKLNLTFLSYTHDSAKRQRKRVISRTKCSCFGER